MTRDDHDGQQLVDLSDTPKNVESVHSRHLDVKEDERRTVTLDAHESFLSTCRKDTFISVILENHLQRVANRSFVVDHENARFHRARHPSIINRRPLTVSGFAFASGRWSREPRDSL